MSAEFELLRFEAAPVSATVAVVELDGRFTGPAPARVRLLIERAGRGVEVPAITAGGEDGWSATFAIALADLTDERTEFALAPGRGPLIALPSPSVAGGPDEDRFLRLAREANELRHRLGVATASQDEAVQLRAQLAEVEQRAEEAERAAASSRTERDEAAKERAAALDEQESLRERLRETEGRLTETERERAALRARAESADRTVADLTSRIEALEERAREAEQKVVAAEDEARISRRELKDTRARLESVLREQRHPGPERRGHEVPAEAPAATAEADADDDDTDTDVLETRDIAAPEDPPGDDEPPRTTATATRATRVVKISDEPDEDEDRQNREARHTREPLDPGRVGAGYIEPSQTRPSFLTPARIMVGIALLLLVVALIAIVLGAGLV